MGEDRQGRATERKDGEEKHGVPERWWEWWGGREKESWASSKVGCRSLVPPIVPTLAPSRAEPVSPEESTSPVARPGDWLTQWFHKNSIIVHT